MSLIADTVTSTEKQLSHSIFPSLQHLGAARRDAARSLREDNWENEGGHLATARPVITSPAISASDVETLEAEVHRRESALANDFVNGQVGWRYNIYAHRARVLGQQKAKLDVLRASFEAEEQRG